MRSLQLSVQSFVLLVNATTGQLDADKETRMRGDVCPSGPTIAYIDPAHPLPTDCCPHLVSAVQDTPCWIEAGASTQRPEDCTPQSTDKLYTFCVGETSSMQ